MPFAGGLPEKNFSIVESVYLPAAHFAAAETAAAAPAGRPDGRKSNGGLPAPAPAAGGVGVA